MAGRVVQFQFVPEDAKTQAALFVLLSNGELWWRPLTGADTEGWRRESLPPNALVSREG